MFPGCLIGWTWRSSNCGCTHWRTVFLSRQNIDFYLLSFSIRGHQELISFACTQKWKVDVKKKCQCFPNIGLIVVHVLCFQLTRIRTFFNKKSPSYQLSQGHWPNAYTFLKQGNLLCKIVKTLMFCNSLRVFEIFICVNVFLYICVCVYICIYIYIYRYRYRYRYRSYTNITIMKPAHKICQLDYSASQLV